MNAKWSMVLCVSAGCMHPFGFAPISIAPLVPLSILIWCIGCLHNHQSYRSAYAYGALFATALFFTGTHWLTISMTQAGGMPGILAWALVALLACLLGTGHGLVAMLYQFILRHCPKLTGFGLASAWVALEWARAHLLTGFPWLLTATSQMTMPYGSLIPIFGPYGTTWFLLAFLCTLVHPCTRKPTYCICIVVLAVSYGLSGKTWTTPQPDNCSPTLHALQANLSPSEKWFTPPMDILSTLKQLSPTPTNHWVIWPEGSLTTASIDAQDDLNRWSQQQGITLLTGAVFMPFNLLITFPDPQKKYFKQHLVPFGEYLPLPNAIISFLRSHWPTLPLSAMQTGPLIAPLQLAQQHIAVAICYDIAFPSFITTISRDTGWILTITEDNWFGTSWGPYQHLEMAQMRSLESGRPQLFVNNAGPSASITTLGQIDKQTLQHEKTVLTTQIIPYKGQTPYQRYGQALWLFFAFAYYLFLLMKNKSHNNKGTLMKNNHPPMPDESIRP